MTESKTKSDPTGLEDAYSLRTPDDSRVLYAKWAETYDQDFAKAHDYTYHDAIARLLVERLDTRTPRILDVGCGTGLVGQAVHALIPDANIDGVDISPEMLAIARTKGIYGTLSEADLTQPGSLGSGYDAVVSAGIFTHGHLGPEVLEHLIHAGRLYVLGINAELYAQTDFGEKLETLVRGGLISDLALESGRIYGQDASHDHADSRFMATIFMCGKLLAGG